MHMRPGTIWKCFYKIISNQLLIKKKIVSGNKIKLNTLKNFSALFVHGLLLIL